MSPFDELFKKIKDDFKKKARAPITFHYPTRVTRVEEIKDESGNTTGWIGISEPIYDRDPNDETGF